ncbi:MAG: dicarboxylate/amino acid:cation symporter [Actinomycetota bacterium]|nr:dicarboxylate/amino acid:cation symporter [Actinomycetota bacterium]
MSTEPSGEGNAFDGAGRLTTYILIGLVAGLFFGVFLNFVGGTGLVRDLVDGTLHVGGSVFIASLKLLMVPLVLVSLICGTTAMDDVSKLGRVGARTLGLYLMTTAIAITLAISAAVIFQPGADFGVPMAVPDFQPKPQQNLTQTLIEIFPTNPIKAMAEGRMLQIIVFAILFGVAINLSGEAGSRLKRVFRDLNEVILRLVALLMQIAPIGVFCLVARVFADQGLGAIGQLAAYFGVVLGVLAVHMLLTYPLMLKLLGGLDPLVFFKKLRAPITVAFSTSSSAATLPVTLRNTEERLGVDNSVASFTIPLGATVNMDGTAIMQGVATVFIAQAYGIDIGLSGYLSVVVTATLASIGTAGVPGVGLVMLAMVLRQVNLPVEAIGLIIGIDRILDMARTAVNITGDAAVSCIVAKHEGQLDMETFADPQAGA